MLAQVKQVRLLRDLCKLMVEQQESVLTLISEKLDELESDLSCYGWGEGIDTYVEKEGS